MITGGDFKTPKGEKKLSLILESCPELWRMYLLKEKFRTICDKINDKKKTERFLQVWGYKAEVSGSGYLRQPANS